MNNIEILAEIERLKTLLKRPEPADGQVWMRIDEGAYYIVSVTGHKRFFLVSISGKRPGARWSDDGFGHARDDAFMYVGMFDELFVRRP
jgi:hypothetical protein